MVAATKNKRGRPADQRYKNAVRITISDNAYNPEVSTRTIQNSVNAEEFTCLVMELDMDDVYDFFSTKDGNFRHKGIAEQIGRMMREGLVTDDQAVMIAKICMDAYAKGSTSKEIEKWLRQNRLIKKRAIMKDGQVVSD